ncbi:BZ3500_MvSof-1268-A1-R1_Chr9g10514 [Microbotryum saponariae]|uniref:BZ3500_MvSof-1268-A1-R1_Chr9g10514 protein n=1 Tax=Microbotryum saponariae TaxID=289078 RepID=A0A2X0K933_9BASI|nr:BZ3501_MvSof-1269-A2-R1_Chr9g10263 [Microbotryum saponariae]SDA00223.1 BZ3500_MvSof-1268-A1-R1_Chr9g10514 [Microbotryum saponariae]
MIGRDGRLGTKTDDYLCTGRCFDTTLSYCPIRCAIRASFSLIVNWTQPLA